MALPPVPDPATPSGADGTLAGVTAIEADEDEAEVPVVFVAVAVNVEGVPFVKGEIVQLVAGAVTVHVAPPGDAVIV